MPARGRSAPILLAAAVVVMLAATACSAVTSSGNATTTSAGSAGAPSTGNGPRAGATSTSAGSPPSTATVVVPTTIMPPASVGSAVSLPAIAPNPSAQVTLVKVVDPAQGADQFAVPVVDSRFVGVQLRISFGGPNPVQEDVNRDTSIADTQGRAYDSSVANLQGCPAFKPGLTIGPGRAALGCVTFEVPTSAQVSQVTFTPGGQFGNLTAAWRVR